MKQSNNPAPSVWDGVHFCLLPVSVFSPSSFYTMNWDYSINTIIAFSLHLGWHIPTANSLTRQTPGGCENGLRCGDVEIWAKHRSHGGRTKRIYRIPLFLTVSVSTSSSVTTHSSSVTTRTSSSGSTVPGPGVGQRYSCLGKDRPTWC
jgi:hypothetical protein